MLFLSWKPAGYSASDKNKNNHFSESGEGTKRQENRTVAETKIVAKNATIAADTARGTGKVVSVISWDTEEHI